MMAVKKIVFVSNYFNHHQKHLSDELYKIIGDGYTFIETIPMNKARIALGWKQYSCSYLKRAYESKQSYYQCLELINNADVVITGSAPEKMIRDRIKNKKLVFRYSER
ncbi:MAG: glycosyltransferase family 1 protein, partial [Clostridia bacterium]|nr:glycosyltransferase family 1 protein [Clostridia bacterium]